MRTNLKTRLFLGIAIAIIFVLVLSFLSYYTTIKERQSEYWVNHTMEVKSKLRDISINLKDYTSSIRTMRRYDNATNIYKDVTQETVFKNTEQLESLLADNQEQNKNALILRNKLDNIFKLWNGINFAETRNNLQKEREYYTEETTQLQQINETIHQMDNIENRLLSDRQKETNKLLDFNTLANIGGTILILIIVSILCYIINREFTQRMGAERKLRENLQKLEILNTKTNNYNDILNGAQTLIAECQKATDTTHFLRILLENIVAFLGVPAAVAYAVDDDSNYLHPVQSHGIQLSSLSKLTKEELPVNEKEANQNVAILREVPETFWKVSTGLGSSKPGQIAYLFLNSNKKNLGVIELGNFKEYTAKQVEYLQMITNAISVRLAAVQIEQNRNSLLHQLQEKQEILINQQEELRLANDELTQQTQVLQASEEELRVQEEELKQINVELEEKNEALESAREVLALKAAELEVSGKYKSEFLANMSHELRTPLNSVLILAGLLRDNKDKNLTTKQIEYSNIIHKSGSDLLKLINDILDLSKIEAGKVDLMIEEFTISSLIENMRQLFFVVAEENEISFVVNIADNVPATIRSDRQKLEQVMKNLLSNAFKFTPKKGTVTLNIKTEPFDRNKIVIEVADTGIGIAADKQAIVFEAFKQADGSTNRKYGGTGLGLSISRELTKILGGNISLTSKENEGSTFAIHIPAVFNSPVVQHTPTRSVQEIKESLTNEIPLFAKELDGSNKTILIIEDDANFSSILQNFAEERNYKTLLAFNGKEGLEIAQSQKPNAIILDMQMPVMDGWEVLKRLKDNAELKNIPVHIISASDDVPLPVQGAIAYLRKPVSKEDLEQAFSLIGMKLQSNLQKLLILKGTILQGELLDKFTSTIPAKIDYDFIDSFEEAVIAGKEKSYDCIIADIGNDIDKGIDDIERLKSTQPFKEAAVIILLDKEISPLDERKLKRVSEAVIMNSKEAQRRLSDELDLFLHKIKEDNDGKIPLGTLKSIETDVLKNKKVMVADDDMRNVFALVSLLEEHQMKVITAGNGKEAIDLLATGEKPDIALIDIMMPEMDGYETMQHIRNKLMLRDLPLIAITAKAMAEDKDLCLAAGASDYISKPVDTQKLLSLMRVWLAQ